MVEQFRAVIDIDGDASGALRAIGQVEAAMQGLDKGISRADINIFKDDNARETLRGVNKEIRTLDSRIQRLKGSDLSSMLGLRAAESELGDIMHRLQKLPGQMRGKGFEVLDGNQERVLKNFNSQISGVHDAAANALARVRSDISTTNKAFTRLEGALEDVDRGARRFKESLSGSTGEMLKHHRALSEGSTRYRELVRGIRSARTELNQIRSEPLTAASSRRALELTDTLKRQYAEAREITRAGVSDIIREQKNLDKAEEGHLRAQEAARKAVTRREAAERSLQNVLRSNVATQADMQRHLRDVSDEYDGLAQRAGSIRGELSKVDRATDPKKFRQLNDSLNDVVRAQAQVAKPIVTQRVRELTKAENEHAKALDRTAKSAEGAQRARQRLNATLANSVRGSQDVWRSLRSQSNEFDRLARSTAAYEGMLRKIDPKIDPVRFNEVSDAIERNLRDMERIARPYITQNNRDIATANRNFERQLEQERALIDRAERQAEDLRRAQAARNRQILAPPGIRGDQWAADQWVADSNNEVARATRRLAEAEAERARVFSDSKSGDAARAAALHSQIAAQQALTRATRESTNAQMNLDKAYNLKGSSARYALYDAAQYQMMRGAVQMAPLAAGAFAYGRYESMFSDVQRTAEIDNGGRLADGRAALNLMDGFETASDSAFRNLLNISTQMPVALTDVFDIAAKGGSVGISGGYDMRKFTEALSMFNAVSDADPAQSAEAVGRIGNLLGTTDYKAIASGVVELGKSAAATDDQILKTTQELSMAAAGANFAESEIIGLSGAFASLSIPPERARSVMLDFTRTMANGLAKTTPEIQSVAMMLGKTVDETRSLWKADPMGLFQGLVKSLSALDEDELVMSLESIGLEGQRALPTFQALTKNWQEMGPLANVLVTSLAAAERGFSNTGLLDDAMANKTDDLAGKFQMLVSSALEFATIFGSGSNLIAGGFLSGLTALAKGLTAILNIPLVGELAGIAASVAAISGLFRFGSGINALFQAGRMSMDQVRGLTGVTQHAGDWRYLFTGVSSRDKNQLGAVPKTGVKTPLAPVVKSGAVQNAVSDNVRASRGGEVRVPITPVVAPGAQVDSAFRSGSVRAPHPGAAAAQTPLLHRVGGAVQQAGTKVSGFVSRGVDFVGGKFNAAMILASLGIAGIGAVQQTTQKRADEALGNLQNQLETNVFAVDENTGELKNFSRDTLITNLVSETQDAMTWWDKIFTGTGLGAATKTSEIMSVLRDVNASNVGDYTSAALGVGGPLWKRPREVQASTSRFMAATKEVGEALTGLPVEQQIRAFDELYGASKLTADGFAEILDVMYRDNQAGYADLVNDLNELDPNLQLSTVWDTGEENSGSERVRNAQAIQEALRNIELYGDPTATGSNYQNLVGGRTNTVLEEYSEAVNRFKAEKNAEGAYYQTIEDATEYASEYGAVLSDNNGVLDQSISSHREVFGAMSAIQEATYTRVRSMRDEGRTMEEIREALQMGHDDFVAFAEAVGMSGAELDAYLDDFRMFPDQILLDIITKTTVSGDMTIEDLLDVASVLPEGHSFNVDVLGMDQIAALRDAGYEVKQITDENGNLVWQVTAREQGLQEIMDKMTYIDAHGNLVIDFSVLSDEAKSELESLSSQLGNLKSGSSLTIHADLHDETIGALQTMGYNVETFKDKHGNVRVRIEATDETDGIADRIKDALSNLSDKNVTIRINVEGDVPDISDVSDLPPVFDSKNWRDRGTNKNPWGTRDQGANNNNTWGTQRPPAGAGGAGFGGAGTPPMMQMVMSPLVDFDTAEQTLDTWTGWVPQHFIPTIDTFANTVPAHQSTQAWFGSTVGLNPNPAVSANTNPAMGASMGWFGVSQGLNPNPLMSSNPAQAHAASLGWFGMAQGLLPIPNMNSNSSPATAVARQWYAYASSLRPTAVLNAVAYTGAAEAALNFAARTRTATIVVNTVGGGPVMPFAHGGFTGRGGKWEPAGIVHRGEYVIPKSQVNQATGLPYMDALGRLARGIVGSPAGYNRGNANMGGGSSGVIELGPASIHQIARAVAPIIQMDRKTIATGTSSAYKTQTRRGSY